MVLGSKLYIYMFYENNVGIEEVVLVLSPLTLPNSFPDFCAK